jgi:hypothetical protein
MAKDKSKEAQPSAEQSEIQGSPAPEGQAAGYTALDRGYKTAEEEKRKDELAMAERISARLKGGRSAKDKEPETVNRPSLKETLSKTLKGVTFGEVQNKPEKLGNKDIFTITIKDREKFLEEGNLRKLIPYFGRMVFATFEERHENVIPQLNLTDEESTKQFVDDFFRQGDLGSTDKIYIMSEGETVQGFYFLKNCKLPNGDKVDHILLTNMDRPYQGTGSFKQLTKTVMDNEDVTGFTALAHTPELVKSYIKLGKTENLDVFFCNKKNGDAGIPLTKDDEETLKLYQTDIARQVGEYEFNDLQTGLPEGYTSFGTGSIPPRRMDEVKLPEEDPVRKTFEDMIGYGDRERPGETIFGKLFVKKPKAKV